MALAREAALYRARRDAARGPLRPTPSASGRARIAAEAALLQVQRGFSAELEAVQADMRDAFTNGFKTNERLSGWCAALAREASQLGAALATVDGISGEGCVVPADKEAVRTQRSVAAAVIQQRIDAVQVLQESCAALGRTFAALRLPGSTV